MITIGKATIHNCDEEKEIIPYCNKGVKGFNKGHISNHWTGRKHSEETKEKMRIARLKNQPMHNPEVVKKRSQTLIDNKTFAMENNNTWKGGITPISMKIRNSRAYRDWRIAVLERDLYECKKCFFTKENGAELHAHHIKPFSRYRHLRFEVSNGITLCKQCHEKEHEDAK
jgi:hypothetical protein